MSDPQQHEARATVGEALERLRKKKDLSTREVATRLHLEPRIVEALEASDFDVLPAATYVRGYLRSYARILGANEDEIISLYNDKAPEVPQIVPDIKHPSQVSSSDKPVKTFTYLLTFSLVLLIIAWLQSKFIVPDNVGDTHSNVTNHIKDITIDNHQQTVPASEDRKIDQEPIENRLPEYTKPDESQIIYTQEENSFTYYENAEIPLATNNIPDNSLALASDNKLELVTQLKISGPDNLLFKLNANSWIEVYDMEGNQLFFNLALTGDEISLNGTAPFDIKLGYAPGVTLEFNGKPFDTIPMSNSGIAFFRLGE